MAESDEIFNEVAQIRDELEEQGAMIDALVHVGGTLFRDEILADMEKDRALREVYRLVDGKRTQGEIAAELDSLSIAKKSSVSLKFDKLAEEYKIIQLVRRTGAGKIYKKTRLGRTLKIGRAIEKMKLPKAST
jgi:hypothetical protein